MATPISALEHKPRDFIREVSPEAITFYVDELSGIYLPDDFKQDHADKFDVKYWDSQYRLRGKFGRFALSHIEEEGEDYEGEPELNDILLMGTTIGLTELDQYGEMASLRHYHFRERVRGILEERDLLGQSIAIDEADYGATAIVLTAGGSQVAVEVSGASVDYGRAKAEGRQQTCSAFERLLGNGISVINVDPEPKSYEKIV